jgi:PAS domain-containing protein
MAEVVSGKISATHDAEARIERPDGSRVTVIVNIGPLKNDCGEVPGAINGFYDITERKGTEQALRQAHVQLAAALVSSNKPSPSRAIESLTWLLS